jgi:hypothetical protein
MTTRVWNLGYLAEMMGDDATDTEATAMRDLLVGYDLLAWMSDKDGGTLADIDEQVWLQLLWQACES